MGTWAGAIVVNSGGDDFEAILGRYAITLAAEAGAHVYVHVPINLRTLRPPEFAANLSSDLGTTVLAFLVQSTASVEQIEIWNSGRLVRSLMFGEEAWSAEGTY